MDKIESQIINDVLGRVRAQIRAKKSEATKEKILYKCDKCSDTGWIFNQDENSYKRCNCISIEMANINFKNSGLNADDVDKNLKNFDTWNEAARVMKRIASNYILRYETIKNTKHNSIMMCGQSGCGKSHILKAVALKLLINLEQKVIYMPYIESMTKLKQLKVENGDFVKAINKYKFAEVLFIDDLLKGKITEADINILNEIFEHRSNNMLPTLITTEYYTNDLLLIDEALGGRIIFACKDFTVEIAEDINKNYRVR
jgi:DNA replication protein DnaC